MWRVDKEPSKLRKVLVHLTEGDVRDAIIAHARKENPSMPPNYQVSGIEWTKDHFGKRRATISWLEKTEK